MARTKEYPKSVKVGSAVVKIYELKHKKTRSKHLYQVRWTDATRVTRNVQFADPANAEKEARLQASKISGGLAEADAMTKSDREELVALRRLAGKTPALAAMQEWARASELTGGQIIAAATTFQAAQGKNFSPILAEKAVDDFIRETDNAGSQGERTYRAKLSPIAVQFAGRELHSISTPEWAQFFARWENATTRNDIRKRATALCRWARSNNYLPRGVELEISLTKKSKEAPPEIGIILPETYGRLLSYLLKHHPHLLAATVVAGFCGERSDEIHGKKEDDREKRQLWEDIRMDKHLMTVTNAKANTPSWRTIPISLAALEWFRLCPKRTGPICAKAAMERVREIGINAGLILPANCFRHSYITYKMVLTGDKQQVSMWAGNSPEQIDLNYRRPILAETGKHLDSQQTEPITKRIAAEWFKLSPAVAAAMPNQIEHNPLFGMNHAAFSSKGGQSKSPAKIAAVTANAVEARASKASPKSVGEMKPTALGQLAAQLPSSAGADAMRIEEDIVAGFYGKRAGEPATNLP